ncbi:MAG: TraR/DksA C4-type zinc finger protein, partial [Spirochaetota bacterium]
DYGKIAATFIDRNTGLSVRIAPQLDVRQKAYAFAEGEPRRYFAQLKAYQAMPDDDLLSIHEVCLRTPVEKLVSRPGVRVNCEDCGEEIINERELAIEGRKLCRSCCSSVYYWPAGKAPLAKPPADAPDAIIATTLN